MLLNLINNICSSPRTANREQISLNFFNSLKDKLLFVNICLALLFQKSNIDLVKSFLSFIKESKSSYFFEWQKSKQKTISFFVKKRNKKTTPFRIRNSLVKIFSQYSESSSLRVKRSNLNLVKTFLTSITFDSLSRKIKNPCLVINNFNFLTRGIL